MTEKSVCAVWDSETELELHPDRNGSKGKKDMRKAQKKQMDRFLRVLGQAHTALRKLIGAGEVSAACDILKECQQGAILLGNMIEQAEGENFATISMLEEYCEWMYQLYERLKNGKDVRTDQVFQNLDSCFGRIGNSVEKEIKVCLEVLFMPYKASMWDSLESVWMAADRDENCDAYVVPIPYYDKRPDGTFGAYHYEGAGFPDYVPVMDYDSYRVEERQPDIIYIHNPYDEANYVTSVDPRFYSRELKKYTECLVYIPYYATTGSMSEGQMSCPAYDHADYIMIQAEKYRKFFDPQLPQEKLVALGSPKFDRVIRICDHPPEPPAAWKKKMEGKKVYFYNTSISGMLRNTDSFLKKMEYVFHCFQGRDDACLVWRPHPLMDATFDSMRKGFRPAYDKLKKYFNKNDIGIYDDTEDITNTIAVCDAYIGDAGTSVTSLFGMAGKPLFILNNFIYSAPEADDWQGEIIKNYFVDGHDEWRVTQGNKLYYSPDHDSKYQFYCDLSQYSYGIYYRRVMKINGKVYVCPINAQNLLVVSHGRIESCIQLERCIEQTGAFEDAWNIGRYLYLIPARYPAIVRYDTFHKKVDYIRGYNDVFVKSVQGEWRVGGRCVWKTYLFIASPVDNHVLAVDSRSGKVQILTTGAKNTCGCCFMASDGTDVWLLPYTGQVITRWNPETGETHEYSDLPEGFRCIDRLHGYECESRPFYSAAFSKDYVYFSPGSGNMFVVLDKTTGKMKEWKPPFAIPDTKKNGYYMAAIIGAFDQQTDTLESGTYRFISMPDRKLYEIDLETENYREIPVAFDIEELRQHEPGFCVHSEWIQYVCRENAFNSLDRFLDGNILGSPFDKNRQFAANEKIAVNPDGTSGEKIHQFISGKIGRIRRAVL